jgi:hypothetical protein
MPVVFAITTARVIIEQPNYDACRISGLSSFYLWIQALEPDPSICRSELPVHPLLVIVSLLTPGLGFLAQVFYVRYSAIQTLAGKRRELNLRHVQPASMLGGIVNL